MLVTHDWAQMFGLRGFCLKTLFRTCCLLWRLTVRTRVWSGSVAEVMAWSWNCGGGLEVCSANVPWFGFRRWVVKRRVLSDRGGVLKTIRKDYLGVGKWVCRSIGKGCR